MAGHSEIAPRAAAVGLAEFYLSDGPRWLLQLAKQATATPIVVNVRGIVADDCPVLVSLAQYEAMVKAHVQHP